MKVLDVFWEKGFEGTSMADLTEHIGIGAQSLYNKFGDKMGLFLATIQFFIEMSDEAFSVALKSKDDASLPEILLHFAINRRFQILDESRQSCFAANSAIELGASNPSVKNMANVFFSNLKDAFKFAIKNAQDKGEIDPNKDPEDLAWYLVNTLNSCGIQKKAGISIDQIDRTTNIALSVLDGFTPQMFEDKIAQVEEMYPMLVKLMYPDDHN